MNKEEFVNGWLSHIKRPNYPQKSIDLMNKELDEMILFEAKKLEQSLQAAVSGSLPLPVKVLQVNGEFIKGELISLQGPTQEGVTLKVHENCLVKIESVEPGCYQNTIIEINKKYISDWGGNDR